ncbi:adipocyte enhancer-binding protein 1-like [Etheostoma spectabile]|uniref:adipocyte enhancer-binding protein 1-like n=1 Tax=Etheostoma spectabile TaxID=54343 RepID=UPI0013AF6EA7|nr:adipocyte enhancer-binding protein 1-like [Etheostoma spectabile]
MRAEVLVFWAALTLCWAPVAAREDVEEDDKLSGDPVQVRVPRGLVEPRRQTEEGGDQMKDEPAEVVQEESTKPKKKKTPEEIEAARAKKAAEKEAKAKKQKAPKPTKKPKGPKPTKKPKAPKPTKKPKAPKATKKPKETTTVQPKTTRPSLDQEEELGWDALIPPVTPTAPGWEEPVEPGLDDMPGGRQDNRKTTTTEVIMYIPEEATTVPYVGPWYEEYDYADLAAKKQEEEEERARKEKAEKAEKAEQQRKKWEEEEEERLKQISVPLEPKKCPPLGLESHRVEDDQLLASSQSHHGFTAQRGRLNMQGSKDEDDLYGGAWCAEPEEKNHWFEVDARREVEFTGVITQGRNSEQLEDFVSSYFVAFSNDSRDWTTLQDGYAEWLFYGNVDKDTPVLGQFSPPVVARYIRILPQSWNGSLCLRAEILACQLPREQVPRPSPNRLTNEKETLEGVQPQQAATSMEGQQPAAKPEVAPLQDSAAPKGSSQQAATPTELVAPKDVVLKILRQTENLQPEVTLKVASPKGALSRERLFGNQRNLTERLSMKAWLGFGLISSSFGELFLIS